MEEDVEGDRQQFKKVPENKKKKMINRGKHIYERHEARKKETDRIKRARKNESNRARERKRKRDRIWRLPPIARTPKGWRGNTDNKYRGGKWQVINRGRREIIEERAIYTVSDPLGRASLMLLLLCVCWLFVVVCLLDVCVGRVWSVCILVECVCACELVECVCVCVLVVRECVCIRV